MFDSLWVAKTGMEAQDFRVQTIANNMANAASSGFKKDIAHFKSLGYNTVQGRTSMNEGGDYDIGTIKVGRGVAISDTSTDFTQGSLTITNSDTDVAISGKGFFVIEGDTASAKPEEQRFFSRNGHFELRHTGTDKTYNLVHTASQKKLMGLATQPTASTTTPPPSALEFTLSNDGNKLIIGSNGEIMEEANGAVVSLASPRWISIATFGANSGIQKNSFNLYTDNPASTGGARYAIPLVENLGSLDRKSVV